MVNSILAKYLRHVFSLNQLFILFSSVKKSAHVIGQTIMCNQNILTSDRSYNISFIRHVKWINGEISKYSNTFDTI